MIDLDHNATTPLDPRVRAAMGEVWARADLGNPSSQHRRGQAAREVVEMARRRVAEATGAEPLGVTFTSGGTESDNLAVLGGSRALAAKGRPHGVLSAKIEHPAVTAAAARLQAQGVPVVWVPVDEHGRVEPSAVAQCLREHPEVGLCSLAAANHELGNAYDVPALVAAVREVRPEVVVHVDAVQALGKCAVSKAAWGVDLISVSAHKIGGPMGVGALVHARTRTLVSQVLGGQQQRGRRGGTEPVALLHGFGLAARLAAAEQPQRWAHTAALRERLLQGVQALGARVHGDLHRHTGNTLNVAWDGCPGELVMMNLDLLGIAVSTGAACSAGAAEPSPVLRALGQAPDRAREAVRISLGSTNTQADVDALVQALAEVVPRVRAAAPALRSAS